MNAIKNLLSLISAVGYAVWTLAFDDKEKQKLRDQGVIA